MVWDFIVHSARKLLIAAALGALGAGIAVMAWPLRYDVSFSLFIAREGLSTGVRSGSEEQDVRRDADDVTAMAALWLGTPDAVADVLELVGIDAAGVSLRDLERQFVIRRRGAQYMEVRTVVSDAEVAPRLAQAVEGVVGERLQAAGFVGGASRFLVSASDPLVKDARPPLAGSALATAFAVAAITGMFVAGNPSHLHRHASRH